MLTTVATHIGQALGSSQDIDVDAAFINARFVATSHEKAVTALSKHFGAVPALHRHQVDGVEVPTFVSTTAENELVFTVSPLPEGDGGTDGSSVIISAVPMDCDDPNRVAI